MELDEAVKKLRGPKGSEVTISITRVGYDQPLDFTIVRDKIDLEERSAKMRVEEVDDGSGGTLKLAVIDLLQQAGLVAEARQALLGPDAAPEPNRRPACLSRPWIGILTVWTTEGRPNIARVS